MRKPDKPGPAPGSSSTARGGGAAPASQGSGGPITGGGDGGGPVRGPKPPSATSSGLSQPSTGSAPGAGPAGMGGAGMAGPPGAAGSAASAASASGSCPLRRWLGPFAGVVFNERGHIACPEPIVRARAALASTAPVRSLRPQAVPIKLLAVGIAAMAVNLPAGALREHFEKFSLGWIVAVHVTVPFVAMLRKAVILPKFALLVTLGAAVAGQVAGSRLERARLATAAAERPAAAVAVQREAHAAAMPAAGQPVLAVASGAHARISAGRSGGPCIASLSLAQWGGWPHDAALLPGDWLPSPHLAVKSC